jgi:drug/metabolite transporter (DMT)-like permease
MQRRERIRWQQILLTVVVSFGIAVLVNWSVLKLFDQKSAERAAHSLIGIILLIAYVARFVRRQESRLGAVTFFVLALIPCYLGTVFPDLDITLLGIGAHRNPVFHSSASFLVLWGLVYRQNVILQTLVLGYGVGLASHLWWDVLDYGDVRWLHGSTIDRLWLSVNGAICLMPLLIYSRRDA